MINIIKSVFIQFFKLYKEDELSISEINLLPERKLTNEIKIDNSF